jgi:hypothetical protein
MPNGRALPEAILVAVARLTVDRRETDGVALRQALDNAGYSASGETVLLRLAELQDDGLVEFYKAGGPRDLKSVQLLRLTPAGRAEAKELDRDHAGMTLSGRTVARLTEPFEGGSGPTHSSIERIWTAEEASDYLPEEGNKAERVMSGLRALRDGRRSAAGRVELPPNPEKLKRVASGLAELLLASRLVKEEDVAEALGASGPPAGRTGASWGSARAFGTRCRSECAATACSYRTDFRGTRP